MRAKLWFVPVACLTLGCAGETGDHHAVHWGYGQDDGPGHRSSMNPVVTDSPVVR